MAFQNPTTYTEVDPNSRLSATATRQTYTGLRCNEDAYSYRNFGAGHFSGAMEHLSTIYVENAATTGYVCLMTYANDLDDAKGLRDNSKTHIESCFVEDAGTNLRLYIGEQNGATLYADGPTVNLSYSTAYYIRFLYDPGVGTYGTIYLYVYSDSDRTALVDLISVAMHAAPSFQYLYLTQSFNNNNAGLISTGYIEDVDLQEGNSIPIIMHHRNQLMRA